MGTAAPLIAVILYATALFGIAGWANRQRQRLSRSQYRPAAYALGMAVYCTSWTYYGAVGSAATQGWAYLPIYVGPILLFLFAPKFMRQLVFSVHQEGASSISDFIGSRFGKSQSLAAMITIIALLGIIPYVALQLRSVGSSFVMISGGQGTSIAILVAAALLALFSILFGTRRYEAAARNEPILFAVAAESLIKLVALSSVAIFAAFIFSRASDDQRSFGLAELASRFAPVSLSIDFPIIALLSVLAFICLPRQFYVGVIEARHPDDVMRARWPFIAYLVITVLAVIPITLGGLAMLGQEQTADFFVLNLPLAAGARALALFVFLGGLAAATAMVVTETVALSTMVSNDLIAPLLLRSERSGQGRSNSFGPTMLFMRRLVICGLMAAASAYALLIPPNAQLASVGLISFVAMAQCAPFLFMAVYRGGGDALAAKAGLAAGFALWAYTLAIPAVADDVLAPLSGTLLDPHHLLGVGRLSDLVHGLLWSLGSNIAIYALLSFRQATARSMAIRLGRGRHLASVSTVGEMKQLEIGRAHV